MQLLLIERTNLEVEIIFRFGFFFSFKNAKLANLMISVQLLKVCIMAPLKCEHSISEIKKHYDD